MHAIPKSLTRSLIFLFASLLLTDSAFASPPDIFPVNPQAGQVFNSSNDVTFTCNATDEGQILNLSLYHDLNGTFSQNQTQNYGQFGYDSNTSFLCHFNGGLDCQAGGSGIPSAEQSLSFQDGKFSQGVRINETGLLRYQTSGNFDRNQGTIEFWIRPGSDITSNIWYIFQAADYISPDENETNLYISAGELRFEIYDSSGSLHRVTKDITYWQAGNWYHIAVLWDLDTVMESSYAMYMLVNGSDEGVNADGVGDPPISYPSASSSFSIGSDKDNSSQINATIDEFRISSAVRSLSEISQSYQNGLANYSNVSKSWDLQSVPDGSYLWSCLAYDNDSQSNQSSQSIFYVDISTPPSVNGIFLSPSSPDDLDPGATINATANATDPSGVNAVIFQWKEIGDENWNNITMAYNASSGLYEGASFQTLIMESMYYYRIWSNDSKGSSGYSVTHNATATWDYAWTRSPVSFGTVSGLLSSTGNLGMLTINNTGDRTLNFTVSDNWPLLYNGSDNPNFYVANHTAIAINITAQFSSESSENNILITINASHPIYTPSPVSLTVNATINSYSGGPYLAVSIIDYTAMVSQSQTFNLSAKVKNIGNETAEGTWLNWTLPEGWDASGNITQFIGNLSSGSVEWSNLTVTVNPSSTEPGTFIINATSSCSGNASGYDSRTVGVSCSNSDAVCGHGCSYVNDDNCGIPTGPAGGTAEIRIGGGGGGDQTVQYIMRMEAPSLLDIQRGDKKTARIRIMNDGKKTNLSSISLLVSGYPLTQIRISPLLISNLGYNQTGWFDLEISVPNYTRYGMHNLTLKVSASGSTSTTRNLTGVERAAGMIIVVHSVQENETKDTLAEAEKAIQEMSDAGLGTGKAISLLEEAKSRISSWDYDSGLETSKQILELKYTSFHITGLISRVEEGIREAESYGIQTPESRKMSSLSKSALQREDYAKAEERAGSAVAALMIESRGLETMRLLYANWHFMIAGSVIFAGGGYLAYRKSLRGNLGKKIKVLSEEEKAIRSLMEKAQEDMYREKALSGLEYHKIMSLHESNLVRIRRRKARLVGRLIKLDKHPLPEFRKQEEALRKEIQGLQKRYYEQGSVTKSAYQKTVAGLREDLAESIRNIDRIMDRRQNIGQKAEQEREWKSAFQPKSGNQDFRLPAKKKGQAGFLIIGLLILFSVFTGMILAQADEKAAAIIAMEKAQGWIKDMEQLGFPASRANDTLNEAKLLFSKGFYKGAESLANDVQGIKERAISIDKRMDEAEASIYQASSTGIEASHVQALFYEALSSFRQEDYGRAEELLDQASSRLEELESDYSMEKLAEGKGLEGLLKRIQDNLFLILIIIAILVSAGIAAARIRRKRKTIRRIKELDMRAGNLNAMMKDLQSRYFEKNSVSQSEYKALMARYRRKLMGIKRKKLSFEGMARKPGKTKGP